MNPMTTKVCTKCKSELPLDDFDKDSRYKLGIRPACRQCRYTAGQASKLAWQLKNIYNMSMEEYLTKLEEQQHVCAICGKAETRVTRPKAMKYVSDLAPRLSIDHDHDTGENRGLLCHGCNVLLGHAKDSEDILQSAIEYLRKYK